jgi:hypothetical protein
VTDGPQDAVTAAAGKRRGRTHAAARKVVLSVVGGAVTLLGIAMLFAPGPGLIVVFIGLWILGQEFEWAERHLDRVQTKAMEAVHDSGKSLVKTVIGVFGAISMIVGGILWGVNDDWPFSSWSTAGTLIGSGVIAAGTAVWARYDALKKRRAA